MPKYMMALDSGTTSNRCILFDRAGRIVSVAQREFTQYFPQPGWVEHDANEIWATLLGVAVEAMQMAGAAAADIAAIGITNQRETTIVWDKATGEPVHHAIVWQCRRTSEYCDELRPRGLTARFREKTGLVLDATSPRRSCTGCWKMSPVCANARRRASCCSVRSRRGSSGS